jgi:opacity protein-like surface antigen
MARSTGYGRAGALVVAAAVAVGLATRAEAAMPGLYFAGFYMDSTLAYSTVDAKLSGFDAGMQDIWEELGAEAVSWTSEITDDTDIGYGFAIGFQFSEYFAAEATYLDMGTVAYESAGVIQDQDGQYNSEMFINAKTKGPLLSGIAIWPMGDRWALDARAGMFFGKAKLRAALAVNGVFIGQLSNSDNKNAIMVGAGVNWSMSPGTAIRLGYTRLKDAMIDRYDVSSFTFSLKYAW